MAIILNWKVKGGDGRVRGQATLSLEKFFLITNQNLKYSCEINFPFPPYWIKEKTWNKKKNRLLYFSYINQIKRKTQIWIKKNNVHGPWCDEPLSWGLTLDKMKARSHWFTASNKKRSLNLAWKQYEYLTKRLLNSYKNLGL